MNVVPTTPIIGQATVRQAVLDLCRQDFLVFLKVELGLEIGKQHHIWWKHLQDGRDMVELAPRDHSKSSTLVRGLALWRAKYDPWCREILILGPDLPSAVENMDKLKMFLLDRPTLAGMRPLPGRNRGPDSRTEVQLKNGVSIKVKSWSSPLRGRHPQQIILDDVVNEDNSYSAEAREELLNRFNSVIFPMKDKGTTLARAKGFRAHLLAVGTTIDADDLYHTLLKTPGYIGERLEAILDDEKKQVLWPERYSYDDLMLIKEKVGLLAFSREYLNQPLSDETTIFPHSLFLPCFDEELSYSRGYLGANPVYLGADFSVPGSTDGDWTVLMALELDERTKTYTVLNYWRERPTLIQKQIEQIEYYCQAYRVTLGFLEDNLFQGIYREHFRTKSNLPLRGHTVTAGNKRSLETGILSMRPVLENQRISFPYKTEADKKKTDQIVSEFNGVRQRHGRIGNETTNDDCVLAMWHAICASRGYTFEADFGWAQ